MRLSTMLIALCTAVFLAAGDASAAHAHAHSRSLLGLSIRTNPVVSDVPIVPYRPQQSTVLPGADDAPATRFPRSEGPVNEPYELPKGLRVPEQAGVARSSPNGPVVDADGNPVVQPSTQQVYDETEANAMAQKQLKPEAAKKFSGVMCITREFAKSMGIVLGRKAVEAALEAAEKAVQRNQDTSSSNTTASSGGSTQPSAGGLSLSQLGACDALSSLSSSAAQCLQQGRQQSMPGQQQVAGFAAGRVAKTACEGLFKEANKNICSSPPPPPYLRYMDDRIASIQSIFQPPPPGRRCFGFAHFDLEGCDIPSQKEDTSISSCSQQPELPDCKDPYGSGCKVRLADVNGMLMNGYPNGTVKIIGFKGLDKLEQGNNSSGVPKASSAAGAEAPLALLAAVVTAAVGLWM